MNQSDTSEKCTRYDDTNAVTLLKKNMVNTSIRFVFFNFIFFCSVLGAREGLNDSMALRKNAFVKSWMVLLALP